MTIQSNTTSGDTMVEQQDVTEFYHMVFPSSTSHKAYEELIPDIEGKRVGDFGCGQSLFAKALQQRNADAVFLDISETVLSRIDYGEKINASLTEIPLEDDHMDIIFCIGVVHHIPEMDAAIGELIRVLKSGGQLFMGVYADKTIAAKLRHSYDKFDSGLIKNVIRSVSSVAIYIKNRKNNLQFGSIEHKKRIDDLLITPLVRYWSLEKVCFYH